MTETKNCEICGKEFQREKIRSNDAWSKRRFCSLKCSGENRRTDPFKQFFSYIQVDPVSQCWNWTGHIHRTGYAIYRSGLAHRFILEQSIGLIPEGLMALHDCDNRRCVNPKHLFVGTCKENMDDMYSKGRNRHLRGEEITNSKLTANDVLAIREDTRIGREIAAEYSISPTLVYLIKAKKAWTHV